MTQEFVTLPREVVEQALKAWAQTRGALAYVAVGNAPSNPNLARSTCSQAVWVLDEAEPALRAALEQPQNHVEQHHLGMVPAGWKLVPVEPTRDMLDFAEKCVPKTPRAQYIAMLAAAPHPPTVKDSLTVEQPQANQPAMTPIAQRKLEDLMASGYTISGYSVYHERKHQHGFVTGAGLVGWWKPDGMEYPQPQGEQEPVAWMVTSEMQDGTRSTYPMIGRFKDVQDCCDFGEPVPLIYQHPQPKREPLTDEQIDAIADAMPGGLEGFMKGWGWRQFARAVIEATHNIK